MAPAMAPKVWCGGDGGVGWETRLLVSHSHFPIWNPLRYGTKSFERKLGDD